MILKPQSMRFVMATMMDVEQEWQRNKWKSKDDMIDPDAPMVVQVGDFMYEVISCGGDAEQQGFVIQCGDAPVGKWEGMEYIKL